MHSAIMDMLSPYQCVTKDDYLNALKEIIQEIALLGLYRAGFFHKASFYGGTALRIFYGLDRFSEDLDFSLNQPNKDFNLTPFLKYIREELSAYGFETSVSKKHKKRLSHIESAFIKAGTKIHLIRIKANENLIPSIGSNELLKIKIEVDTHPPKGFDTEVKYLLNPIPFHVTLYTLPSLFAGKVHALLFRAWRQNRVKGRDFYDLIWYLSKGIPVHLNHLENRMRQTGHFENQNLLDKKNLLILFEEKFSKTDFNQARMDVIPFIKNPAAMDIWSETFFNGIVKDRLTVI